MPKKKKKKSLVNVIQQNPNLGANPRSFYFSFSCENVKTVKMNKIFPCTGCFFHAPLLDWCKIKSDIHCMYVENIIGSDN